MKEKCNAEFKAINYIPGNIHSEKSMVCNLCLKTCHTAGSSYLSGNSLCKCCTKKIDRKQSKLKNKDIAPEFLETIYSDDGTVASKDFFLRNKWRKYETERRIEKRNKRKSK